MKLTILGIISIFLIQIRAFAQNTTIHSKNYVGLGIGYNFDRIKDTNLSPLNQKSNALFYTVFYERRAKDIIKLNLNFTKGNLNSGSQNVFNTGLYRGSINFTYLKNLSKNTDHINFYIGGSYNLNISYLDWMQQEAFSYLTNHGVNIHTAISKQISQKQYIESSVAIPAIQFIGRPPYNGIDEFIVQNQDDPLTIIFNTEFGSFNSFKAIHWNVNYNYELSSNIDWRFDYNLNIQKVKLVNDFTSISNQLSTSILYNF